MPDFAALRTTMVASQLRPAGVTDPRLLEAMGQVPRELFLPPGRRMYAYLDAAAPLTADGSRALIPPAIFARLVQAAGLTATDRVLDVGCGPGYSTAVLSRLAGEVTGLEWDPALASAARTSLLGFGTLNARIAFGPPDRPPTGGAYDAIIVEGSLDSVPAGLGAVLAEGGRLAVVLRGSGIGVAWLYVREGAVVTGRPLFDAPIPPLVPRPADGFAF